MIPQKKDSKNISIGFAERGTFDIKANAKAFKILSSNIYQNKIAAIVRELSTNAADAHIMAGTENIPFEITLPSRFSQEFKIRDFGTGLSHEQILTLYVTYFDSTKETTNNQTGMLGLGSKSPFSYIDTFTVNSYQDGVKRIYAAYINDDELPGINYVGEIETQEPNGLEISFPVPNSDHTKFREEAINVLYWFDSPFKINGFGPDEFIGNWKTENLLEHLAVGSDQNTVYRYHSREIKDVGLAPIGYMYERRKLPGTNCTWVAYISKSYNRNGFYVKQGPVLYPVDAHKFGSLVNLNQKEEAILSRNIVLEVEMGEVDFDPGRENINYDKMTLNNIKKYLEPIFDQCVEIVVSHFKDHPGPNFKFTKDFLAFSRTVRSDHRSCYSVISPDKIKNTPVFSASGNQYIADTHIPIVEGVTVYDVYGRKSYEKFQHDLKNRKEIFLADSVVLNSRFYYYTLSKQAITKFCDQFGGATFARQIFIIGDEDSVKKQLELFGKPEAICVDDTLRKIQKTKYDTAQFMEIPVCQKAPNAKGLGIEAVKCFTGVDEEEGVYFFAEAFNNWTRSVSENTSGYAPNQYTSLISHIHELCPDFFGANKPIKILRKKDVDVAKNNPDLEHIDDYILRNIHKISEAAKEIAFYENTRGNRFDLLVANIKKINDQTSQLLSKNVQNKISEIYQLSSSLEKKRKDIADKLGFVYQKQAALSTISSTIFNIAEKVCKDKNKPFKRTDYDVAEDAKNLSDPAIQAISEFVKEYPLIDFYGYSSSDNMKAWVDYINGITLLNNYNKRKESRKNLTKAPELV